MLAIACISCAPARRAHAQFIGYTSPQTVQQTLATTLACTGSAQTFAISNLGQTQHYVSIITGSLPTKFKAEIDGIDKQGNVFRISDQMENAFAPIVAQGNGSLYGTGYFPQIQVVVTCSPNTATFTASYSGAWGTFNVNTGTFQLSQIDKVNFSGSAGNVNQSDTVQTPFGSTAGTIFFQYSGSVAGGTLNVTCTTNQFAGASIISASLANNNTLQIFPVPDTPCPLAQVQYVSGGAATSVQTEYVFAQPGSAKTSQFYTHITGTTATAVKTVPGFLHTLTINTGGAGTVSVFDLASASCTGTPATNTVAVITAVAATLQTFTYDVNLINGICVKASAAMDLTVSAQ